MITAMILATGPSIESRIDYSGASHGMFEPAVPAGAAMSAIATANAAPDRRARVRADKVMTGLLRGDRA